MSFWILPGHKHTQVAAFLPVHRETGRHRVSKRFHKVSEGPVAVLSQEDKYTNSQELGMKCIGSSQPAVSVADGRREPAQFKAVVTHCSIVGHISDIPNIRYLYYSSQQ